MRTPDPTLDRAYGVAAPFKGAFIKVKMRLLQSFPLDGLAAGGRIDGDQKLNKFV